MVQCCFWLEEVSTEDSRVITTHRYCSVSPSTLLLNQSLSIGRKKRCWLRLPKDLEVSSVHAEFRPLEDEMRLVFRDVGSTNGTKVNGKMLKPQHDYPLSDGDVIVVGRTRLRLVLIDHEQSCGEKGIDNTALPRTTGILPPCASSSSSSSLSVAQSRADMVVMELKDEEVIEKATFSNTAVEAMGSSEISINQPDTEPDYNEVSQVKDVVANRSGMDDSTKEKGEDVELREEAKGVDECTLEKATCTKCRVVIGQLDLLAQQAHLNECIGGRAAVPSTIAKRAQPKTRKGRKAGKEAKKSHKVAISGHNEPRKTPRKRKRPGTEEDIVLALALSGMSTMDKEQQTDVQLAVTKHKLQQLDVQMAKLAKRRTNLVKTLSRLEKTKEKLQKSQVLPPAKVLKLLDLTAAFKVIFPHTRQAFPKDKRGNKKQIECDSIVALRYLPSRWRERGDRTDCNKDELTEDAIVAATSMWTRASQQHLGLQRDSLLYYNNILRAFDRKDDGTGHSSSNVDKADSEDADCGSECKAEYEEKLELVPVPLDHVLERPQSHSDVPDVVKRVFPNWQRDFAFLVDQAAEEIEMALEAMERAQAEADAAVDSDRNSEGGHAIVSSLDPLNASIGEPFARDEQRLACNYMAQVMKQLIDAKRRSHSVNAVQQQVVIDLIDSKAEDCQQVEPLAIVDLSENEPEEQPYESVCEELPQAATVEASNS